MIGHKKYQKNTLLLFYYISLSVVYFFFGYETVLPWTVEKGLCLVLENRIGAYSFHKSTVIIIFRLWSFCEKNDMCFSKACDY